MKKTITLLFVCFLALQAQSQVTVKPGVRAGLNLSNLSNSDLDTKSDFYVGGLVAIKLARFYTLQPEVTYSKQGAKGEYNYGFASREVDYSLQYLSLGIINKFDIVQGFHAVVGPTLDFKVGDNFGIVGDDLIGFDFGLTGGLGYTLPMGLTIEARYKMGLIDIFGDTYNDYYNNDYYNNDENYYYDDAILNSVIQLGVSYQF